MPNKSHYAVTIVVDMEADSPVKAATLAGREIAYWFHIDGNLSHFRVTAVKYPAWRDPAAVVGKLEVDPAAPTPSEEEQLEELF